MGVFRFLLLLWFVTSASAQERAPLVLSAEYSVQTDSNVLRLPSGASTHALTGRDSASEQISISRVGLSFVTRQSLQKLELNVSLTDHRYQNFDYLSYDAKNIDAAWRWALTPRWTGNLTAMRSQSLNSYADFSGYRQRNQRTDTSSGLDTKYEWRGPWRLIGGVVQTTQGNEVALVGSADHRANSVNMGVRYVSPSGRGVTLRSKRQDGTYLYRIVPNSGALDDRFLQADSELAMHWPFGGGNVMNASIGQRRRTHPNYSQRDYEDTTGAADLTLSLSGKSSLNMSYARDASAYATSTTNYSRIERVTLGAIWQASTKVQLRVRHTWSQTEYVGAQPFVVLGAHRNDLSREAAAGFDWKPNARVVLSGAFQNTTRTSNVAGNDYDSTMATITARYSY